MPGFLLFGKAKFIGGIKIDAMVEEVYNHTAVVTKYPIEEGAQISDHVVDDPDSINLTGKIAPVSIYALDLPSYSTTRIYDTHLKLLKLKEAKEPITIVTGLKSYKNMVIESYTVSRTKDTGGSLSFAMNLTNVKIVKSQTSTIPAKNVKPTAQANQVKPKVEEAAPKVNYINNQIAPSVAKDGFVQSANTIKPLYDATGAVIR